jgi:hypothetical protein
VDDDRIPASGTKVSRRWIKPSEVPDAAMLEPLPARFRGTRRIVEAWLVAGRITPSDGRPPYETTDIALVLDPPSIGDPEVDRAMMVDLIANLTEVSLMTEGRHGWLFVTQAIMRAHADQATLLHRAFPSSSS